MESFGPRYVVERELGRGAMGRVFLARDLRLDREVAIKALPPELLEGEPLQRLEQEARAAGSLNHPNILAVYDIGSHEGRPYIVSEYLRGETLRARLERGALPLPEVLNYAAQLARGLAAAHERGVVHRDLKPENLFVTEEGFLKILDFGIARRAPPEADQVVTPAEIASLSPRLTSPGAILGTVGYMSPEQVLGRAATQRSDLFALGLILHEMLTGKRAFAKGTVTATSFAVVNDPTPPLPSSVPDGLRKLVTGCLEKAPENRPASAREIAGKLDHLRHPRRSRKVLAAVVVGLVVVQTVIGFFALRRHGLPVEKQITFHPGGVWTARFGPQSRIYYSVATDALPPRTYWTDLNNPTPHALALPPSVVQAVSTRGDLAVLLEPVLRRFEFEGGPIAIVPAGGVEPRTVLPNVGYADFDPNGDLAVLTNDGTNELQWPPGHVLQRSQMMLTHVRVAPGGDRVALLEHPIRGDDAGHVVVIDRGGNARTLTGDFPSIQGLSWSRSGDEIWFTGLSGTGDARTVSLRAVDLSGKQRELLAQGNELHLLDVGQAGVLLTHPDRRLGAAIRTANSTTELSWLDQSGLADIDESGSHVLLAVGGQIAQQGSDLYLRDLSQSTPQRLGEALSGAFTHDGRVLAVSRAPGHPLRIESLDGSNEHALPTGEIVPTRARMLRDGSSILMFASKPNGAPRLYRRTVASADARLVADLDVAVSSYVLLSPDEKQIVVGRLAGAPAVVDIESGAVKEVPDSSSADAPCGWIDAQTICIGPRAAARPELFATNLHSGARRKLATITPEARGAILVSRALFNLRTGSIAYNYASMTTHLYVVQGVQ